MGDLLEGRGETSDNSEDLLEPLRPGLTTQMARIGVAMRRSQVYPLIAKEMPTKKMARNALAWAI